MQPTHVYVSTVEGRRVPIPQSEATSPGAGRMFVDPGKVYRVPYSSFTRRRILAGDLVLTNRGGTKVGSHLEAKAPHPSDTAHDQHDDGSLLPESSISGNPATKPIADAQPAKPTTKE